MTSNVPERPDISTHERASHELVMQILKLRWIGMEVEAERMVVALRHVDPTRTLLAGPFDTD